MPITDLFDNPIDPSSSSFLGFRPLSDEGAFPHDIYSFLIKSMREADAADGDLLVLRWLKQAQTEFELLYARIKALLELSMPAETPADALPFLQWIVGFSGRLGYVTADLAEADLRRLISVAARMWKFKGTEFGMLETLEALTTRKARIVNYFDFRLLSDEWELGREDLGFDPWLINEPGMMPSVKPTLVTDVTTHLLFDLTSLLGTSSEDGNDIRIVYVPTKTVQVRRSQWNGIINYVTSEDLMGQIGVPSTNVDDYRVGVDPDEYVSDLRIVDDGTLDRTLVENIVALLRPAGERYNIRYVDFMDTFRETLRWNTLAGTVSTDLDAGLITLGDVAADTEIETGETGDSTWTEYQAALHFMLDGGWGELRFYGAGADDFYAVRLDVASGKVTLEKVTATVRAVLNTAYLTPPVIYAGVNYFVRVAVTDTGAGHQISYFVDENLMGIVVDSDHSAGKLGVGVQTGQELTLRFAEMFQYPLESTRIGPA